MDNDPATTIKWPLFRERVRQLKAVTKYSDIPKWADESDSDISNDDKASEDESLQYFGKLHDSVVAEWGQRFHELDEEWRSQGIQLRWCIVEGWHLYYDPGVVEALDLRVLLRCPSDVLRKRKEKRVYKQNGASYFATTRTWPAASNIDIFYRADGSMKTVPPYYWDHFAYPAYLRSHSHLFCGEVEAGPLSSEAESAGTILLDGEGTKRNLSCDEVFQQVAMSLLLMGKSKLEAN
ncbi:ribosylnicotinamide kinase [Ceratobasidium sp. 423]|nr:ribosylnicotinamide kinase [Ceratobasidium sp. 423]